MTKTATILAGLALATAGLTGPASATSPTAVTTGLTGTIVASGGKCVGAAANGTKPGTPVILWDCLKDASQQWTPASDGSVRIHGADGQCITSDTRNKLVLGVCGTPSTPTWLPRGDHTVAGSIAGAAHKCMTAPAATRGTQLTWGTCSTSASEHFTVPSSHYASTALSYRPDSGGGGDTWALDTMTRRTSITWLGGTSYVGSIVDSGSYVTVPGNFTPNQGGKNKGRKLGDVVTGTVTGSSGYQFSAPGYSSTSRVPASVKGVGRTSTGNWMTLFFAPGTQFSGPGMDSTGPEGWSWTYTDTDKCGTPEKWTDSYTHSGQDVMNDGNIIAPAPYDMCPANK